MRARRFGGELLARMQGPSEVENQGEMKKLSSTVRARLKTGRAGDHPDANLLAAFAERALVAREREQVLAHLARCVDCRDVVALAAPALTATSVPMDTEAAHKVSWFAWPVLRWGALAACVVIVGTAVLVNRQELQMAKVSRVAEVAAPASAAPPAAGYTASETDVAGTEEKAKAEEITKKAEPGRVQTRNLKTAPALTAPSGSSALFADKGARTLDLRKKDADESSPTASRPGAAGNAIVGGTLAQQPKPPAPVPAAAPAARDDAKSLAFEGRNVRNVPTTPSANSTMQTVTANEVQVQAEAVAVENVAPGQAKREPGKAKQSVGAGSGAGVASYGMVADTVTLHKEVDGLARASERSRGAFSPATRWTISSDGQLQHSIDSGKSWQPVVVADNATFRALSFNGPDVWVGGAAGLLYHSADSGGHWVKITPMASGAILVADISAIEFTDPRHGKLTTSKGEVWLTDDGGQTWRKQS